MSSEANTVNPVTDSYGNGIVPLRLQLAENVNSQLLQYFAQVQQLDSSTSNDNEDNSVDNTDDPLLFWDKNKVNLNLIAPIAQDLLCAPASQAFVERVFSVCSILCAGKRSSTKKSLPVRVFLKVNQQVLRLTGFRQI